MTENDNVTEEAFDEACRFMIAVGRAAHSYGSTTIQIEAILSRLAAVLGHPGTFRATMGEILLAFDQKGEVWQGVRMEALPPAGQELNHLARLGELVKAVAIGF